MKKFSELEAAGVRGEASAAVLTAVMNDGEHGAYVGLDVHKDTIAVAVAWPGRGEAQYRGEIANTAKALSKLAGQLGRTTRP